MVTRTAIIDGLEWVCTRFDNGQIEVIPVDIEKLEIHVATLRSQGSEAFERHLAGITSIRYVDDTFWQEEARERIDEYNRQRAAEIADELTELRKGVTDYREIGVYSDAH
jgi:hypothetical protein